MARVLPLVTAWHRQAGRLPGLQLPAEDEANAKAREGDNLGTLAGILAEVGQQIFERAKLQITMSGGLSFIGQISAIVHNSIPPNR